MKESNYDDIINLPHHVSAKHPQMTISDRAAQFSPFAALTGYESVIRETARLTNQRMELDEYAKAELNEKLRIVQEQIAHHPEISVTYFVPDERKSGGEYVTVNGKVKKIEEYSHTMIFDNGTEIPLDEIIEIR